MSVIKRNGNREDIDFNKTKIRLLRIAQQYNLDKVDVNNITKKTISSLEDGITTSKLDDISALISYSLTSEHYQYEKLALYVTISNFHKNTLQNNVHTFSYTMTRIRDRLDNDFYKYVLDNADILDKYVDYGRDYKLNYRGFMLLHSTYLMKDNDGMVAERPQDMFMRVAIVVGRDDINHILETYDQLSNLYYVHGTPTLFNAGVEKGQLASCFLTTAGDSMSEIADWWKNCAMISKNAGGIGSHLHDIRARGSLISTTGGKSNGVSSWIIVADSIAKQVDQGGGKRPGAHAIYIEPWHLDIYDILLLKKNRGNLENSARHLFYAMWLNDEFMRCVRYNKKWYLMCPSKCPGLSDVYDKKFSKDWIDNPDKENFAFTSLYRHYISKGLYSKVVNAQDLLKEMSGLIMEAGNPYMLFKDAANRYSNQNNLGTIKSSNLCTEIIEYSSIEETAVCNLASICLDKFVENGTFNYDKLNNTIRIIVKNLNNCIDVSSYPIESARNSNMKHRPIGIGIQGLADVFVLMGIVFDSDEANKLNIEISEAIYYAALDASCDEARANGVYDTYNGSLLQRGIFRFDHDNIKPINKLYNWSKLRDKIQNYGVRNSLLVALMPTKNTSIITGSSASFEPYYGIVYKMYTQQTSEKTVYNEHFLKEMCDKNLWNENIKNKILLTRTGSIQDIEEIPLDIRQKYKIRWDVSEQSMLNLSAARAPFIDQSQSLNIYIKNPTIKALSAYMYNAWVNKLITASYYIHRLAVLDARKVTVNAETVNINKNTVIECTDDVCTSCSS